MKSEEKIIKEIAEQLDCGMVCFLNKKTGELKFVVDENDPSASDVLEFYQEDFDYIDKNRADFTKIDKMSSGDSFQVMADFVETVNNKKLQEKLYSALNKNKPFRNFNNVVDNYEDLRQAWFKFKNKKQFDWVKMSLNI
jgi:hypothetical protein